MLYVYLKCGITNRKNPSYNVKQKNMNIDSNTNNLKISSKLNKMPFDNSNLSHVSLPFDKIINQPLIAFLFRKPSRFYIVYFVISNCTII